MTHIISTETSTHTIKVSDGCLTIVGHTNCISFSQEETQDILNALLAAQYGLEPIAGGQEVYQQTDLIAARATQLCKVGALYRSVEPGMYEVRLPDSRSAVIMGTFQFLALRNRTGSPLLDQMRIAPIHDLFALLEHPDFLQGVDDAQIGFLAEYQAAPLDEDQMITLVEKDLNRARGNPAPSYFWSLGIVYGIINEGLTYATPQRSSQALSALLAHPDFRAGVADAQECFGEWYAGPLTLDQMIEEIEENLSRRAYQQSASLTTGNRCSHPSYIHHLGFVFGLINEGLAYAANSSSDVDLSTLVKHPDFLQGVSLAQENFLEYYAPAPLNLDEMVNEVEENLSRAATQEDKAARRAFGSAPSYIHRLGFVFGTINEGLTQRLERHNHNGTHSS